MNRMKRTQLIGVLVVGSSLVACAGSDGGDEGDSGGASDRPVSLVVGFDPGGESDTGARGLAPYWEEELGAPVVTDSRPGAGMQIALEYSWERGNDGQTILWHNQQYLSAIEAEDPDIPYRTDQWVWLGVLENDPAVITARADSEWQNLSELIDAMEQRPGEITVGLLTGSIQRLGCIKLFNGILGVEFREVPQESGEPMRTSLVGGDLDVICSNDQGTYALGDDVRNLAVFSDSGSVLQPDVPPVNDVLKERGVSETVADLGSLRGAAVPRPFMEENPERFETLKQTYMDAINSDEYQAWLEESNRAGITQPVFDEEAQQMISDYNEYFQENKEIFAGD